MLQDHIKFRCFPPKKKKPVRAKKKKKTKTAAKPKLKVPVPDKKLPPQVAAPLPPVELDMEAIRDSLHGYQDAAPAGPEGAVQPSRGQSGDSGPSGNAGSIFPSQDRRAILVAPIPPLTPVSQSEKPLNTSVRDLTDEDLAASAGISPVAEQEEKPQRKVRRRKARKKKINWDPFSLDNQLN